MSITITNQYQYGVTIQLKPTKVSWSEAYDGTTLYS